MNGVEEKRLCRKCGKRLPSSNNFCMFCGCNNDLPEEQQLENSAENLAEKNHEKIYSQRESNSLTHKMVYIFIMLDIIFISFILYNSRDKMFYKKFTYNLDHYDKVINLDNNSFLALKNKKIKVLGDSNFEKDEIEKINKNEVLDIGESYPGSGEIFIEINNKVYFSRSYFSSLDEKEIKNMSGNLYKDINNEIYNKTNENDDYYNIISDNYFIKDGSLYKNEPSDSFGNYFYYTNKYKSTLVLDKDGLDIENPVIIGSIGGQKNILVKGDNVIKVFADGRLVRSIDKVVYNNKEYEISDFKYVLYNNSLLFVCKNGYQIKYKSSLLTTSRYGDVGTTNKVDSKALVVDDNNNNFKINYDINYKGIIVLIIAVVLLLSLLYYFRDSQFLFSSFVVTGYFFLLYLILLLYSTSKTSDPDYWYNIKASFYAIPIEFLLALMVVQIREIAKYILYKLNIETIYHFPIMVLSCASFYLATGYLANESSILLVLPGIMWVFFASNDEIDLEYDFSKNDLIKVILIICANFILAAVCSSVFHIAPYFLCILIVSFSISCCMILNDDISIIEYFRRLVVANVCLFLSSIVTIILGIISVFRLGSLAGDSSIFDLFKDTLVHLIGTQFLEIVFILAVLFIISIVLYFVQPLLKNFIKSNNRLLKILIMMLVMIVITSIVVVLIPYMTDLYTYLYKLIFNSKASTSTSLFKILQ